MRLALRSEQKLHFLSLAAADFDALAKDWGWPAFRTQQVRDWVYDKLVAKPSRMVNLPKAMRDTVTQQIEIAPASIVAHQSSDDGTQKLLLGWTDGGNAETVMIPDGARHTACV